MVQVDVFWSYGIGSAYLAVVFVVALGGAIAASLLIHALGWPWGLGAFASLAVLLVRKGVLSPLLTVLGPSAPH